MIVTPIKTGVFKEHEDLLSFIVKHVGALENNAVLVVTSKIVALSEGRIVTARDEATKEKWIRSESEKAVKTKYVWLTLKDGMMMANAGIDESNADGKLILLPQNGFASAATLHAQLTEHFKIENLGILITDSHTAPLRSGVTGVALGYAGFHGLRDYRGKDDIFGRKFAFSQTNVADGLAAAAVLVMGEGSEQTPLALITDAPVVFSKKTDPKELFIDPEDDMYGPLFTHLRGK